MSVRWGRTLWIVVALFLLYVPLGLAVTDPPCQRLDEWEVPHRVDVGSCTSDLEAHTFWVHPNDRMSVWTRTFEDGNADLAICLIDPNGYIPICADTGGPGNAESITLWRANMPGWWQVRTIAGGRGGWFDPDPPQLEAAQRLTLDIESAHDEDDCGVDDAPDSFSNARGVVLPLVECSARLIDADLADFYAADLERNGTLILETNGSGRLCAYAPSGYGAGHCEDVDRSGSVHGFSHFINEAGIWRIAFEHRPGVVTGQYGLDVVFDPPNHPPNMVLFDCTPTAPRAGDTVNCRFRAAEPDGDELAYWIDWGDGSPLERVPATGTVTQAVQRNAPHVYGRSGNYTLRAFATDVGEPAMTSAPRAWSQAVLPGRPVMRSLDCAPAPARPGDEVSCIFDAMAEGDEVAYTVNWGDGTPVVRVPPTGFAASGVSQVGTRTWTTTGTRTVAVTPVDNGTPALTGVARTTQVVVAAQPPALPSIFCSPQPVPTGSPVTCSLRATDVDSAGVAFTLDWGDGVVERVPPTGFVPQGSPIQVAHTYARSGFHATNLSATDDTPIPQTGAVRQTTLIVGSMQTQTGENAAGTPAGVAALAPEGAPAPDGAWVELDAPGRGDSSTPFLLFATRWTLGPNIDARFYDAVGGSRLDSGECARSTGSMEACNVPAGARYALILSGAPSVKVAWQATYVH